MSSTPTNPTNPGSPGGPANPFPPRTGKSQPSIAVSAEAA